MKNLLILFLLLSTISCQREKMNEVGVSYNKSLIIPPNNDLPNPVSVKDSNLSKEISSESIILESILDQTDSSQVDESIIEKIDNESGYKTDENFFQWLFKGKSKR